MGVLMKELLLDDIFLVVIALLILGISSMFLSPELAEKTLIGVSSALAGIAKGKGNI
jgi:hypothetical protein